MWSRFMTIFHMCGSSLSSAARGQVRRPPRPGPSGVRDGSPRGAHGFGRKKNPHLSRLLVQVSLAHHATRRRAARAASLAAVDQPGPARATMVEWVRAGPVVAWPSWARAARRLSGALLFVHLARGLGVIRLVLFNLPAYLCHAVGKVVDERGRGGVGCLGEQTQPSGGLICALSLSSASCWPMEASPTESCRRLRGPCFGALARRTRARASSSRTCR